MTVSWDFNTATIGMIVLQIIFLIVYLVKTNGKANAAFKLAEKALARADNAHDEVAITVGQLSLLREKVAGEHPTHDAIEQMESRLTNEIHSIRDRLDQFLDRRPSHR